MPSTCRSVIARLPSRDSIYARSSLFVKNPFSVSTAGDTVFLSM